jgi:uroporphyrinogen decarboxylase
MVRIWRKLDAAWARLGSQVAIQGNLDPIALFAPWPELQKRAQTGQKTFDCCLISG